MSISPKDVEHIARLARIELSPEETVKFEKELSGILQFIASLNTLDTSGVLPVRGGTLLTNKMRRDEIIDDNIEGKSAELMEAVPEKKEGWVKVKAIFE
ncbi:MAG: Asp-tRNA(Asn)/Glu-tRNA(Gln) amidotransferase subunit GatC [Candidatus Sungbacteria bacterium]|nr:Asp-tRNA(Asn)/Glu-tRNA(Gln) amidotransferase subunit GatC [Candidatus Sungbacteria bacterium]